MHADLGKTLRPEQNFRPMVDVEGNEAKLCVCPLCGEWQKYIARLYARYAELEPSILWVRTTSVCITTSLLRGEAAFVTSI